MKFAVLAKRAGTADNYQEWLAHQFAALSPADRRRIMHGGATPLVAAATAPAPGADSESSDDDVPISQLQAQATEDDDSSDDDVPIGKLTRPKKPAAKKSIGSRRAAFATPDPKWGSRPVPTAPAPGSAAAIALDTIRMFPPEFRESMLASLTRTPSERKAWVAEMDRRNAVLDAR